MIQVYRNATQLVSVVAGSASLTIAFFAEPLLYAWTGDKEIASNAAPILTLYALGNGVLAISAFPYYLQYALGNLRYHLIGNLVTVITLIPAIIWAASEYGGVGAGWAWLGINSLYLILWVGYVHSKFVPDLHKSWLIKDVLSIFFLGLIFIYLINLFFSFCESRIHLFFYLIFISVSMLLLSAASASTVRNFIFYYMNKK